VVIPLLLRGLVDNLLTFDYSTFFLLLVSPALTSDFIGKCVMADCMRS